jgi:hypothetical protein
VDGVNGLLNVALIAWLSSTPVAPFTGLVETTTGRVVSGMVTVSCPQPATKTISNTATKHAIPDLNLPMSYPLWSRESPVSNADTWGGSLRGDRLAPHQGRNKAQIRSELGSSY